MATYNSESTIEKSLISIREQDFDQKKIEILVVDGNSTDKTRDIAKKYGCEIIDNPERLPEIAKMIGLRRATGIYVSIMDSDEALVRNTILTERYRVLVKYPYLKCLTAGLKTPSGYRPCSYYVSEVGDPFTCFVYGTYSNSMHGIVMKDSAYDKSLKCYVKNFKSDDIHPIGDCATTMDLRYIHENYSDMLNDTLTATLFEKIVTDTGYTAFVEKDDDIHYSDVKFKTYLAKLRFRILNNIFAVDGSGYSNRAKINQRLNVRKYLFPFYTISLILPLIDGIRMSINYKHWIFLFHPFFCLYVLFTIVVMYIEKIFGIRKENTSYAK